MTRAYLDNAATTPVAQEVVEAMVPVLSKQFGNPSSSHSFGREVKGIIETARRNIAKRLKVTPGEIIFTSGGTEADNMALDCSVRDLGVTRIITSEMEHHAVGHTAENLKKYADVKVEFVRIDKRGNVDLEYLNQMLSSSDEKTLVSLMHANNEVGTLLPLKEVGQICRSHGAYFHSDTVQTMGHYDFDLSQIEVDFITCAAHKFHGPKGVGFLYVNKNIHIKPLIHGGSQERDLRGGTENVIGIVGLSKAVDIAFADVEGHEKHVKELKAYMIAELKSMFDDIEFNGMSGDVDQSLYTVLSVLLPATPKASMMLFNLDILGIACSGGSACSSGSNKGSHVLEALGADTSRPAVRFSFSRYTTKEEIDLALAALRKIYEIE